MSSNYYGAQAGEIADAGGWWDDYSPEEYEAAQRRAEDPPDWYLEQEAERHAQIHRDQEHGGGECDCQADWPADAEAPF